MHDTESGIYYMVVNSVSIEDVQQTGRAVVQSEASNLLFQIIDPSSFTKSVCEILPVA